MAPTTSAFIVAGFILEPYRPHKRHQLRFRKRDLPQILGSCLASPVGGIAKGACTSACPGVIGGVACAAIEARATEEGLRAFFACASSAGLQTGDRDGALWIGGRTLGSAFLILEDKLERDQNRGRN
jgi:hypothetical protein